jgi:gamma-glutamyltranspeptidase/glutathione hydrolase
MHNKLATWLSRSLISGLLLSQGYAADNPHRDYADSATISSYGIVATSQTLASQAGAAVLEHGGSAVDAAIAANAALGVIEPMMNGVGGDLFAIIYDAKTRKVSGINSSGWAPKGTSIEFLRAHGVTGKIPSSSPQTVTVPGAVAGWAALQQKFGKLSLKDDLAPAIFMAKNGIPIPEMDAQAWRIFGPQFAKSPGFAATFLPQGHPLTTGELFRNPDLARTLQRIASNGAAGFYEGPVAAAMVTFLNSLGNPMTAEDLSEFKPEWVTPISTTYHGWTVHELPPNGQGIAALEMLNIMERFPLKEYGHNSVQALHTMIEAKKLAYADLARYVADQRFSKVPVSEMLSKSFAEERAKLIGASASCQPEAADLTASLTRGGKDTTYLTAVDRDGNIVSLIQSNAGAFGSGLVAPGTGFVLQNRGGAFSLDPKHPNAIAPRKRPFHTIIPGLLSKSDTTIGFGIMGGLNQPQAHAQFVSNVVDFNMDIQAALDAARFTKPTFSGCDVLMESRIPESVRTQLEQKGHNITVEDAYTQHMGRGNAVMVDAHHVKYGASDPRADGQAVSENPGFFESTEAFPNQTASAKH